MRALWHAHISLLTTDPVPESEIDHWVQAQIPDYDPEHPDVNSGEKDYYELVKKHMLHGPRGVHGKGRERDGKGNPISLLVLTRREVHVKVEKWWSRNESLPSQHP